MKISAQNLPGTSKLYSTYLRDFNILREYYSVDYRSMNALRQHAALVSNVSYPRQRIVDILKRQNREWNVNEKVDYNINALIDPHTVAVVTGQQVGIFGGPLLVLYKALTCIKLANKLSSKINQKVVPIFWMAADDDDVAEVNRLTVVKSDNSLASMSCVFDTDERRPVFTLHLTENIKNGHQEFSDFVSDTEFKREILGALEDAYDVGQSLPNAFAIWLNYLLGDMGLIILNSGDLEFRALGRDLLLKEFGKESLCTKTVLQTNLSLVNNGYTVQVPIRHEQFRFNFYYVDKYRHPMIRTDDQFISKNPEKKYSESDFFKLISQNPERFSPNVIMRPILQDFILPTIAYVAGPAEISYFAQLKEAYNQFDVPMPAIYPRKSITLLEQKIKRVLEKYNLQVEDFWSNVEDLINKVAKTEALEKLFEPVAIAQQELDKQLDVLKQRAAELDPTLAGFMDKERNRVSYEVGAIEKKLLQAFKHKNEVLGQQIIKASNSLYPNQGLQERTLSYVPFLCKYSINLIQRLYDVLDLDNFDHQIVEL